MKTLLLLLSLFLTLISCQTAERPQATAELSFDIALSEDVSIIGGTSGPVAVKIDKALSDDVKLELELEAKELKTEEYDVVVNEGGLFPLNGKLVVPEGRGKVPVAILVHGSGVSDYNSQIAGNKPFEDIAFGLAEYGIATLRFDKRYYRNPTDCDMSKMGALEETIDDVNAAIELVSNDNRFSKIFIIGHSQGGSFAPTIAAMNDKVDGIISLAGTLRPIYELVYDQTLAQVAQIDPNTLDDNLKAVLNAQIAYIEHDIAIFRNNLSTTPDSVFLFGVPASYWKSLDAYWGDKYLDKTNVPMLICQGGKDFQVYPDKDYPLWEEALKARDNVEFKLYPELNHLFVEAGPTNTAADYNIPKKVSEEVIKDVADFINK